MLSGLESTFTALDATAFLRMIFAWVAAGRLAEYPPKWRPLVSLLMHDYRDRGMTKFLTRQPRLFDISPINSLRQGTPRLNGPT